MTPDVTDAESIAARTAFTKSIQEALNALIRSELRITDGDAIVTLFTVAAQIIRDREDIDDKLGFLTTCLDRVWGVFEGTYPGSLMKINGGAN